MSTNWIGGKPAGCVSVNTRFCQLLFSKSLNIKSECFSHTHYNGSIDESRKAAELRQRQISDEYDLTKNMYRIVSDEFGTYVEVKLQNDLVMLCEVEHIPLVESRIWTGNKASDKYTYYVKCRASKKRNQDYALFHRLAYPQYKEIDHINRNGLDNRKQNIREGSGRVNANNRKMQKNNTSGTKGVYFEGGKKPRWRAQWINKQGEKKSKSFAVGRYGDKAKQTAIDFRNEQQGQTDLHLDGYYMKDGVAYPYDPSPIVIKI